MGLHYIIKITMLTNLRLPQLCHMNCCKMLRLVAHNVVPKYTEFFRQCL